MAFSKRNKDGSHKRYTKAVIDCSNDDIIVEQSHKDEVNINNIVKRHGIDMLQKIAAMQQPQWDNNPSNDFQESMEIVTKAQQTFEQLSSDVRKKFNNNPAEFMDYVQNPENQNGLISLGLASRIPETLPIQVEVTNQPVSETPPI